MIASCKIEKPVPIQTDPDDHIQIQHMRTHVPTDNMYT